MSRAKLLSTAVLVWLSCASAAMAGLVCYEYQYAPNLVRAVQQALKDQGLYKDAVDAKWGPKTRAAVSLFQRRKGIRLQKPMAGELEERTLKAMFGDDAPKEIKIEIRNPHNAPEEIWSEYCH